LKNAVLLLIPIVAALFLLSFSPAAAYWSDDPGENTPIHADPDQQSTPRVASDGAGGAIVAYFSYPGGSNTDIYAQRIDAGGQILWTPGGVPVCTADQNQGYLEMCADGEGGALITWTDYRTGAAGVYAQRIDSSGTVLWTADGAKATQLSDYQWAPQIASDGAGGAIVTWHWRRIAGQEDIYAQRFDAAGDTLWPGNGLPVCLNGKVQAWPQITADGSGGAIIVWEDMRNDSTNGEDLYAQRIDANGDTLWQADGVPVCTTATTQEEPQLVCDGHGGAIISWQDWRANIIDIYAQRIGAGGTALWTADGIGVCTAQQAQMDPKIASDEGGGAYIVWEDNRDGGYNIWAQRVDSTGQAQWTANGLSICTAPYTQFDPMITGDGTGGAIMSWEDYRDGDSTDIYAQRIDPGGQIQWTPNGAAACTAGFHQHNHRMTDDGRGGTIIVWEDIRDTDTNGYDIYAQKIDADGWLGPAARIVSIEDVSEDQGQQVDISWKRSHLDIDPPDELTWYSVWRRDGARSRAGHDVRSRSKNGSWTLIDSVQAQQDSIYTCRAATVRDSSSGGIPYAVYRIRSHVSDTAYHWDSAPDSGYSVDDIRPAAPAISISHGAKGRATSSLTIAPITGRAKGNLQLFWDPVTQGVDASPETGPIHYRIYSDTTAWFFPGPGTLLDTTSGLSYEHTDGRIGDPETDLFYLVTAVDGSDNVSAESNRAGEIDWVFEATTGTDYAWIGLALDDSALVMASDLEAAIEAHSSPAANCLTVSQWNAAAQTYTHYTTVPVPTGDFALAPGLPCRVETDAAGVFTLVGAVPAAGSLSFQLESTTGTDYTWISLPLELDTLTMASNLEAHIEAHGDSTTDCLTVSQWNATSQTYIHYTTVPVPMGDFAIRPGRPYRVEVSADALWPYHGRGAFRLLKTLRRR
jgi:hypothetical protein